MPPDATITHILDDVVLMTPQELTAWRKERTLTQAQLASHLEVSLGTIRKYEQGERKIPAFMWRALRDLAADLERRAPRQEAPTDE